MSNGKAIRFTNNGNGFTCSNNYFSSFDVFAYVKFSGKTELGSFSDNSENHINFTGKTFEHIWGAQPHSGNVSTVKSIQVNSSGIVSHTLEVIKERVNSLREEYDSYKKKNQPNNTQPQNSQSNNSYNSQSNNTSN